MTGDPRDGPPPAGRPEPGDTPPAQQPPPGATSNAPPLHVVPQEPPWFAVSDPGPPRGSPEAPPWVPLDAQDSASWSATLDEIVIAGARRPTRSRGRRRIAVIGAALVGVVGIVGGAIVFANAGGGNDQPASAGGPQTPFCETGTSGSVTTMSTGDDSSTPIGAVAVFLAAAIDDRSAAAARAAMADAAPAPTVGDLQRWISALPTATDAWCARIATTDSTARLIVDVRVHTPDAVADVARGDSFYVSATEPDRWSIDAIVAGGDTAPGSGSSAR